MARRVFFSFHYERDIWRVNQVRNNWVTKDREVAGYWDASLWEEAKKKGDAAIKKMIDDGLVNTSVTAVLIGSETSSREYVQYEIIQSYNRGNGLLGIYIHNLRDAKQNTDIKGNSPFGNIYINDQGRRIYFSEIFPIYDWINDDGYNNFSSWVESAAKKAGR